MYREKTNVIYYTNLVCDEMNKCYDDDYERRNILYNIHSALMNFTGNTLTTINGEFMYLYEKHDVEELLDSIETTCINDINKNEHINECDCNCRKCWTNKLGM